MHSTRNDMTQRTRSAMVALLNARLADALDLAAQAKQAHWNVRGANFIALHELFDKLHDAAGEAIDVAARAGDADSSDLFTGISRDADKYLWMLEAHL
jgi:starvation-inducible DNA-binding protein